MKQLTVRNLEPISDKLEALKKHFNCGSTAQALIRASVKYIALEKERDNLMKELSELKEKHRTLNYGVDDFFNAMEKLKNR
ncbi:hypothetical protein [Sphingobacterium kitahiroshimense]|uniref:hypothetical protein n=1 Tax=Sphingobacterium kitahiroshimense TaxID=470446 RepID=UPI003209633E